jgi:hypothetical protein
VEPLEGSALLGHNRNGETGWRDDCVDACSFEKCKFTVKTDQNSAFFGRKAHIPDRIHVMMMYISFYGFLTNSNFSSKSKWVLAFGFTKKR